ncbi:hypothetical protein SBOR_7689 [Sclerotinia borealis F-4128]|uniref:Uncharacterized protein n=1 Tax=Sclerotinia borealis (strain F-4128) TaxID=1432307 RepID=W9CAQ4_SCLBF|nr:hypothetical protein SBOR_7689 [Sclerotinia borealis F-4128]
MAFIRDGTILAVLQSSLLFGSSYAAPASGINPSQASILSQQAYNLCLYESSLGLEHEPCTSFGVAGLPPMTTVIRSQDSTATFLASFLTEYAALTSPILIDTVIDGTSTQAYVGEHGQVWAKLGDVGIPSPTEVPDPPITNEKELKRGVGKTTKKTTAVQQPTTKAPTSTTTAQAPPPTTTKAPSQTTTSQASTSITATTSSSIVVTPSSTSTSPAPVVTSSTSKTTLSSSQSTSSSSIVSVPSVTSASTTKSVVSSSSSSITSSITTSSASSTGSIPGSITGSITGSMTKSSGTLTGSTPSTLSGSSSTSACIASTYVSAGSTYTAKCTGVPVSSSSTCRPSTYVTSGATMTASCKPTSSVCSASTYVTSGSTITAGCTITSACTASTKIISGKTTVASCTQASIKIASWTTNKVEQSGVKATAFNSAKASSVASGIQALLSQWNGMGNNSTETSGVTSSSGSIPKVTSVSLTTFATSKVPSSTGAAIKRRGL